MLTLHRLRAQIPADAQPVAARLALQSLAAGLAEATPTGLPPQSLFWVRRVRLALPATLLRRPQPAAREWLAQPRQQLEAALRQARRPALEAVPDSAEAVLFADPAELLAALAWAAQRGELDRWWWRGLLGRAWPDWPQAWAQRPEARPGALRLLANLGWRLDARNTVAPLARMHAGRQAELGERGEVKPESVPEPGATVSGAAGRRPVRGVPKAQRAAKAAALQAAIPALPSLSDDHAVAPLASLGATPALSAPAPGAALAAEPGLAQAGAVAPGWVQLVAPAPTAPLDLSPGPVLSLGSTRPQPRRAPSTIASIGSAEPTRDSRPPEARAALEPAPQVAEPLPPVVAALEPRSASQSAGTPHEPALPSSTGDPAPVASQAKRPASLAVQEPAAAPLLPEVWPWPQALASRQAPLLFVVSQLLEEGLYPDFTRPLDPGLPVPLWALLPALARAWRLAPDPLTSALARRAPDWSPPEDFEAWLADFARKLRRRLCQRLHWRVSHLAPGLTLREPARVWLSEAEIVAQFPLERHDIAWRQAGLDRDPGWLPSAGCSLRFEFI